MDIITSTYTYPHDLEYNRKENDVETLRQNLSNILKKDLNLKIRGNLRKKKKH